MDVLQTCSCIYMCTYSYLHVSWYLQLLWISLRRHDHCSYCDGCLSSHNNNFKVTQHLHVSCYTHSKKQMCLSHVICQAWPLRPWINHGAPIKGEGKKHPHHQPDFQISFQPDLQISFQPDLQISFQPDLQISFQPDLQISFQISFLLRTSTWRTTLHVLSSLRAFSLRQRQSVASGSLFQRQRSEHLYSRKRPLNRSLFPMWSLMMLGMCLSLPASAVDTPPGYLTTTSRFTLWEGRGVTSSILGSEPGTRMQSTLTLTICGFLCHEITRCTSMYQEDSELVLEFTFLSSDTQTGDSNWTHVSNGSLLSYLNNYSIHLVTVATSTVIVQ